MTETYGSLLAPTAAPKKSVDPIDWSQEIARRRGFGRLDGVWLEFKVGRQIKTRRGIIEQREARIAYLELGDVEARQSCTLTIFPVSGFVPFRDRVYECRLLLRPNRPALAVPNWRTLSPAECRTHLECPAGEIEAVRGGDGLYRHKPSGIIAIVPQGRTIDLTNPERLLRFGTGLNSVLVYQGERDAGNAGSSTIVVAERIKPDLIRFPIDANGRVGRPVSVEPHELLHLPRLAPPADIERQVASLRRDLKLRWHPDRVMHDISIHPADREKLLEAVQALDEGYGLAAEWMEFEYNAAMEAVFRQTLAKTKRQAPERTAQPRQKPTPPAAKVRRPSVKVRPEEFKTKADQWVELLTARRTGNKAARPVMGTAIVTNLLERWGRLIGPLDLTEEELDDPILQLALHQSDVAETKTLPLVQAIKAQHQNN